MFLFQLQELDLLAKRLAPVKIRAADDLFDLLQREFQFSEQEGIVGLCCPGDRGSGAKPPLLLTEGGKRWEHSLSLLQKWL